MATSNKFPILWDVQSRFPISHVLFVQILSTPGGGRVPRDERRLHRDARVRGVVHGFARAVDLGAFPRVFAGVHDGLCVGRRNEGVRMSFLGLFPFTAPYLAWVLLAFSMVMGNPPTTDVVGICVGHSYYWLEHVYPKLAEIRGFRWVERPLAVPSLFTRPWFRRRVDVQSVAGAARAQDLRQCANIRLPVAVMLLRGACGRIPRRR